MGVLYEHWRPDTNECFYVGISWANEQTRPHDLTPRNPHHGNVVLKIKEAGLNVEVRIQACDLSKEELCELEIMQIAYWRNLIGDKLTNIAQGGEGLRNWTDEMRINASKKQKEIFNDPVLGNPRKEKLKELRLAYYNDPIFGEERKEKARLKLKKATDKYWCDPKHRDERRILKSQESRKFWDDEVLGEERRRATSKRFSGENNPSKRPEVKLKKKKTREMKGPDFYKLSESSKKTIGLKNKKNMLEKGDLIHTKKLEVRQKNSKTRKIQWSTPEFRGKMMYFWWWTKNVKNKFYWGA